MNYRSILLVIFFIIAGAGFSFYISSRLRGSERLATSSELQAVVEERILSLEQQV